MKIGIDIHEVINAKPDFFRELMGMLVRGGAQVHVISGPTIAQCRTELEALKIYHSDYADEKDGRFGHYTHIFSIVDYHIAVGTKVIWTPEGPEMDPYLWNETKAAYCEREKIDLHIDDSDMYGMFFKTPYARFFSNDTPRRRNLRLQRYPEPPEAK